MTAMLNAYVYVVILELDDSRNSTFYGRKWLLCSLCIKHISAQVLLILISNESIFIHLDLIRYLSSLILVDLRQIKIYSTKTETYHSAKTYTEQNSSLTRSHRQHGSMK